MHSLILRKVIDSVQNPIILFEEGKEIFLYENIEDCVAKINYLLALLPAQACELRMFAREAAISKKHSYKDMALQVMEVLEKL